MSIQVPSPSYGSVAGADAGPSEPDPTDPGAPVPEEEPPAGPLAGSSDRVVDRSDDRAAPPPIRRPRADSSTPRAPPDRAARTRARPSTSCTIPPAEPVPENKNVRTRPKVRFGSGLQSVRLVRIAGGWGRAR